jgi:hypothetical protein
LGGLLSLVFERRGIILEVFFWRGNNHEIFYRVGGPVLQAVMGHEMAPAVDSFELFLLCSVGRDPAIGGDVKVEGVALGC